MSRDFGKIMELAQKLARTIFLRERIDKVDSSKDLDDGEREYIMQKLGEPSYWLERSRLKKDIDHAHQKDWEKLRAHMVGDKKIRHLKAVIKVAAIFIGVVGLTYLGFKENFITDENEALYQQESITLELENGAIEKLTSSGSRPFMNGQGGIVGYQKDNQIDYSGADHQDNQDQPLQYHRLTVPYGKTFQVVLSDGTRVHLNAGTMLRYPVRFVEGRDREVFMEGEALFDVSKDARQPFVVHANQLGVKVLGTQFVVSSYPEDTSINTILLEGSVGLYRASHNMGSEQYTVLKPGFMGSWNKAIDDISVKEVDTDIYTAWTNGRVVFSHLKFNDIIKKLARCYNVSITNNNARLGEATFTATFDIKVESIRDILESFKRNYGFDYDYRIEDNQVNIY